ncbi:hypothetical protein GCM10023165_51700 [Variovorax defluvii]|uniref:SDR family oxidoreductase n=1 Tax=Variovorax defluvii TaxID=913761 RepID=A0ABP8IF70_9BURK
MTFFHQSASRRGESDRAWALVTGGSGRGGAAIVRALHARGLSVVIHHTPRSLDKAMALQAELERLRPSTTELWAADFSAEDFSVPAWLASKGVAVLVCNASAYHASDVGDIERTHIDIAIHVAAHANILAALRPTPGQRQSLRSVVAITDIAVDRAPRGHVPYTTAKGALQSMILALANEWAPHVRFNVVQGRRSNEYGLTDIFGELASAVVYLAIDAADATGQVLVAEGWWPKPPTVREQQASWRTRCFKEGSFYRSRPLVLGRDSATLQRIDTPS